MITAIDNKRNKAVLGIEIDAGRDTQKLDIAVADRYSCLFCGDKLKFYPCSSDDEFNFFRHDHEECFNDGNVSQTHRLAQEVVSMQLFNYIPNYYRPDQLDIEKRIGDHSDFVISDIRLPEPIRLAVEIMHLNNNINLRRRLETYFDDDYSIMLVGVTTGRVSPDQVQHHLRKLSSIQVGRFDPHSLELTLGSVISPEQIDPATASWDLIPDYIS